MMRKGVSAVVSLVLIVLLTVSSSLIFYIYFTNVSSSTQEKVEESQGKIAESIQSRIKITTLDCGTSIKKTTSGYWNLNENYGPEFRDISGNENHGQLEGDSILNGSSSNCEWVEGRFGRSLEFNHKNSLVRVEYNKELDLKNQITLIGWFKASGSSNDFQALVTKGKLNESYGISFNPYEKVLKGHLPSLGDEDFNGTITYRLNSIEGWHHFTLTWSSKSKEVNLYVDGELKTTKLNANGTLSAGQPLYFGNDEDKEDPFQGKLDEIAIFNRSLSKEEIQNYNRTGNLKREGIEGFWKFDQGIGNTAYDTHHIIKGKYKNGARLSERSSIAIQNSKELSPTKEITLEAFIKPEEEINRSNPGQSVVCTGTIVTSYCLYYPGSKGRLKFDLTGLGSLLSHKNVWKPKWHHVVATYDGEKMELYINGNLDNSKKISGNFQENMGELTLGNRRPGGNLNFKGKIDEVRVNNAALEPSSFLTQSIKITVTNAGSNKIPAGDWVINLKTEKDRLLASQVFEKDSLEENRFLRFSLPVQAWNLKEGESYKIEVNAPGSSASQICEAS